jgi:hypothetical protein
MRQPVKTVVKILIASLIVGWILKALDIDAMGVLRGLGSFVDKLIGIFAGLLEWAIGPVVVGAVVVVPIWLIWFVWRKAFDKSGTR